MYGITTVTKGFTVTSVCTSQNYFGELGAMFNLERLINSNSTVICNSKLATVIHIFNFQP